MPGALYPGGSDCAAQMTFPLEVGRVPQRRLSWATSSSPRPPSSNDPARLSLGNVPLLSATSQISVSSRISRSLMGP